MSSWRPSKRCSSFRLHCKPTQAVLTRSTTPLATRQQKARELALAHVLLGCGTPNLNIHACGCACEAGRTSNIRLGIKRRRVKTRLNLVPGLGWHRPQRPYEQERICAEQEQVQAVVRGQKVEPDCRRSNHDWTEHQPGRQRLAKADADWSWRVHTADVTRSRNAASRATHCNFTCQGARRPRIAAGSRRNGTRQAMAATTGT